MPRRRRAPRSRSRVLATLNEAIDYAITLRLLGTALTALDNEHGRAVLAAAWNLANRLDTLKAMLK
jgi:hypothetical protein